MANTNSNLVTSAASSVTDGTTTVQGYDIGGAVKYAVGKVTIPATPSASDTLTLLAAGQLPVGAVVVPAASTLFFETDPGTALTLDIGTTADPDKYADALACNAAGAYAFTAGGTNAVGVTAPAMESTATAVIATVMVSTAVDATVMHFVLAYRTNG